MDGGTTGRGDQAQPLQPLRKRAFAGGGEQPFGVQLGLQAFIGQLQCALAGRFDGLDRELVVTAGFIQGDACPHQHQLAVFDRGRQENGAVTEHGTTHLGRRIFQAEIQMAGGRPGQIADFAFQPDLAEIGFQQIAGQGIELRRLEDAAFGGGRKGRTHRSRIPDCTEFRDFH